MALQIANCCNPIPGCDRGHMRRDWVVVHQLECRHAQRARRPIRSAGSTAMGRRSGGMYDVNLEVRVVNERGVLGAPLRRLPGQSNILTCTSRTKRQRTAIHFKIQVRTGATWRV